MFLFLGAMLLTIGALIWAGKQPSVDGTIEGTMLGVVIRCR